MPSGLGSGNLVTPGVAGSTVSLPSSRSTSSSLVPDTGSPASRAWSFSSSLVMSSLIGGSYVVVLLVFALLNRTKTRNYEVGGDQQRGEAGLADDDQPEHDTEERDQPGPEQEPGGGSFQVFEPGQDPPPPPFQH